MKVFVAGATGVVGRRALTLLSEAGHSVTALARGLEKASLVSQRGATPVEVDLFDPDAIRSAVAEHDVVVNLATKIPAVSRSTFPGAWRENDRIRSEGSRNLADAALAAGAGRFIQESFAPAYPDRGDEWIEEDTPLEPASNARTVLDAETQAKRFTAAGGIGVVLRFGLFYGPDGVHVESILKSARRGIAPTIGRPGGFMSSIHMDDAASAVVAALNAPAGTYNVVDDEPLTRSDFAGALAKALGRDRLKPMPAALVKLGGSKFEMLKRSQRMSNTRFRDATGWRPKYPSAREGWAAAVAERAQR